MIRVYNCKECPNRKVHADGVECWSVCSVRPFMAGPLKDITRIPEDCPLDTIDAMSST